MNTYEKRIRKREIDEEGLEREKTLRLEETDDAAQPQFPRWTGSKVTHPREKHNKTSVPGISAQYDDNMLLLKRTFPDQFGHFTTYVETSTHRHLRGTMTYPVLSNFILHQHFPSSSPASPHSRYKL
jgi:hypothetical protein